MAKKNSLTSTYDSLPLLLRVVLQLVFGVLVGGIYRIVRFTESGNILLLWWVLSLPSPVSVT